jgi:hypothetical protein
VHRDLSPDNIMLRQTKEGDLLAKIIDLGIAKRIAGERPQMTSTGIFLGKFLYCSPEQAGGLPPGQSVDARSDLYSFGVVLYQMLAGRPLFEGSTPEEYLGKHLHTVPPPLDTSRLPSRIGPGLAAIVAKALEKQRDRRFSTAREFAQALAKLEPGAAEPLEDVSGPFAEKERRRFPYAWLLAALILVGAAAAVTLLKHRETPLLRTPAAAFPAAPSEETPTPAPDETVIAPRIVEQLTPPDSTPSPESARTPERPAPTPMLAAPAPVPTAAPALEAPAAARLTAPELRRWLEVWSSRPIENRAHRAMEIAKVSNSWVASHPKAAFRPEVEQWLPKTLKANADTALENGRPFLAKLFFRAYKQLSFAPPDPEFARRVREPWQNAPPGQ